MLLTRPSGATSTAGQARIQDWRLELSASGEVAASHLPQSAPGYMGPRLEPDLWQGFAKLPARVQVNLQALSANVRANDPTGDAGPPAADTQAEVAVAAWNQYVVVAWNDSKGFTAGFTFSSFGYSSDYGQTFTDGGNVPLIAAGDQAFGDCTLGVDNLGNFYLGSIYTTGSNEDIAVWHGSFSGSTLTWNTPVIAAVSTAADKPSVAADPFDNNVYVAYTDFAGTAAIKVTTSSNQGTSWGAPVTLSTASGSQGARPWVGPDHEVYVVWEEGWGFINCDLSSTTGSIAYSVSTNHGATWSPKDLVGSVTHNWTSYGPGDIRGRAREFPDIAIDRSSGPGRGSVYVVWNEAATYDAPSGTGATVTEGDNTVNDLPGGATSFNLGDDLTGSVSAQTNNDYFKVNLTVGQHCLFRLEPQGFRCGITSTTRDMLIRLYPTPANTGVSPPDTLLAYSELNGFMSQIHFDCPKTGTYYLRVRGGTAAAPATYTGTYTVRTRALTYTSPSGITPARDQRDIVAVRRPGGVGAWSAKLRVDDDPANLDNSMPFITCDDMGNVHVFWYDARESGNPGPEIVGAGSLTDIYTATSTDGGVSFAANQRVSDESSLFNFNVAAVPNRGDYNSACTAGTRVYAGWSDERLSNGASTGVDAYTAVTVQPSTGVAEAPVSVFRLLATRPNPVRTGAAFTFELPQAASVTLEVFDARGGLVRSVLAGRQCPAGRQTAQWDLRTERGGRVPSGIYFYRMKAGRFVARRALVVLR